jgi:transposase
MLHVGLDLSRHRLDVCVLDEGGEVVSVTGAAPDADGLRVLASRFGTGEVRAVVESMTGARFVHDTLEGHGWTVEVADAQRVKALAPLTAKTDRIDAKVLADLSYRDLIPSIWLPPPGVRSMRELARFRLHLVKHRTGLKNRIHSTLITWGRSVPVSDLFGVTGRRELEGLGLSPAWAETTAATLEVIDHLDTQINRCVEGLREAAAAHPQVALLQTAPGIGPILGFTIASEIGDITRFPSPRNLVGYSGLCPRVHQSGNTDRRGPLTKHGPQWLRWALIEATIWASRHPCYQQRHQQIIKRLGPQRGPKVARVDTARRLATAIWWMLTRNQPFNPGGSPSPLVA